MRHATSLVPRLLTRVDATLSRGVLTRWLLQFGLLTAAMIGLGVVASQMEILDKLLIYFPQRELSATPAEVGMDYTDVYLTTADGVRIHGWHVPGESDTTLLWLHGNAGNISNRVDNIAVLNRLTGLSVLIVDYRGYGLSDGSPSEKGLYLDAEAAFDYLVTSLGLDPVEDIVLFGRSLGVGVAAEMATRHAVRCVILESGFTSVMGMAKATRSDWLFYVLMPFIGARYDTLSKIDGVMSPVMIVHGESDETVPYYMAEQLFEAAREPKRLYPVRGAMHNNLYERGGAAYFQALREFIADPT